MSQRSGYPEDAVEALMAVNETWAQVGPAAGLAQLWRQINRIAGPEAEAHAQRRHRELDAQRRQRKRIPL